MQRYKDTESEKQNDRETERDRERQRETERDRERQRETERDRERQRDRQVNEPTESVPLMHAKHFTLHHTLHGRLEALQRLVDRALRGTYNSLLSHLFLYLRHA
jgi:hypothetical protein